MNKYLTFMRNHYKGLLCGLGGAILGAAITFGAMKMLDRADSTLIIRAESNGIKYSYYNGLESNSVTSVHGPPLDHIVVTQMRNENPDDPLDFRVVRELLTLDPNQPFKRMEINIDY